MLVTIKKDIWKEVNLSHSCPCFLKYQGSHGFLLVVVVVAVVVVIVVVVAVI